MDEINKLYNEGNIYYFEENYLKALKYYLTLFKNNIYPLDVLRKTANIFFMFGNYGDALKYTQIAIDNYNDEIDKDNLKLIVNTINNQKITNELINSIPNHNYKYRSYKNALLLKNKYESSDYGKYINNYLDKIDEFSNLINTDKETIFKQPKIEYRYFCYRYLDNIRQLSLPKIELNQINEAVIIEFRKLPHIEFIIRNTIHKLGDNWSHTIICGNNNIEYMQNIINTISPNIKLIKFNFDNLTNNQYSELLLIPEFWDLFKGEKILIYQEDTCIFKTNINDFIHFDYIGGLWIEENKDTVGNGGLSLRSKNTMKEVLIKTQLIETEKLPEDLFFSKYMKELNIGMIADEVSANNFSSELYINVNAFGGHCFFLYNVFWKVLMFELINSI